MGNSEHMNGYLLFREMYKYLRERGMTPKEIADFVGKSQSALRRYMSAPGTKAAVKPPLEVSDRLVVLVDITTNGERDIGTKAEYFTVCDWRDIVWGRSGGLVWTSSIPRWVLADIAGADIYSVAWVGRTHPRFGIQPTDDMVQRARAAEALAHRPRAA